MRKRLVFLVLLTALLLAGSEAVVAAEAKGSPKGRGPVILIVQGAITNHDGDGKARFTLARLKALGVTSYKTSTAWTDGVVNFEGVLARQVMEAVGATGHTVLARAIDGYFSEIPMEDFHDYDVILAYSMNGKRLTRRDKGPVWVMYPWDSDPALKVGPKSVHAVWQLERMIVQ